MEVDVLPHGTASHSTGLAPKTQIMAISLLSYCHDMKDKAQRVAGIFIAPLVMLAGLWLCLDGLEHGGLSGIFSIGPFVAVAGALWFVSDWFE
jgi:hypothetical protein